MPIKSIYLTIDDSPSKTMGRKLEFLSKHKIPAVFFCRGEFIPLYKNYVVTAIQQNYLIGNHSYTHPYFSHLPLTQCIDEILETENLIEECYQDAGKHRPCKVIRLPFGDRGAGEHAKKATSDEDKDKVEKIQIFLKGLDFIPLKCSPIKSSKFVDTYWDWDAKDYKARFIQDSEKYLNELKKFWDHAQQETYTLLIHDFDNNHHLFEMTLDFLLRKRVTFLPFH